MFEYSQTIKAMDKIRKLSSSGIDVINLAGGGTLKNTPLPIIDATKMALDEGVGASLTETAGLLELREIISRKLAEEENLNYDPEREIIITVGAKNAILFSIMATTKPGDEVIILSPFWPSFKPLTSIAGAVPKIVDMRKTDTFEIDESNLRKVITPRSKMIILNNPNNPTGKVFGTEELELLCAIAEEYDLTLLSDECYRQLLFDRSKKFRSIASFPKMKGRTIIIYSFGKAYTMHGWRLGYAVAKRHIVEKMIRIQSNAVSCPTTFAQKGGVVALSACEKYVCEATALYKKLCDITVTELNSIERVRCAAPDFGYCAFPDVSQITTSTSHFADFLLERHHVGVTPGSAFGNAGNCHVRVNYRHEEAYLREGLRRLRNGIEDYMERS